MRPGASKAFLLAILLVATVGVTAPVRAAESNTDEVISRQETMCQANIATLSGKLDRVVLWSNLFMIAGAVVSALGSGLAGFLSNEAQRKTAAVVGALGAVLSVMPKALPDRTDLQARLSAAEKHYTIGSKFLNECAFAEPGESLTDVQKYVYARFTDCASFEPPSQVPNLPRAAAPTTAFQPAAVTAATVDRPPAPPAAIPSSTASSRKFVPEDSL